MSAGQVVGSTFSGGLRSPNYVNGRLLTAEDLRADQEAMLARLAALGRAVGSGVVDGLEVTSGARQVTVNAGLGINGEGSLVRVAATVTLAIGPEAGGGGGDAHGGGFDDCAKPVLGTPGTQAKPGPYVLTARPASQLEGRVPVKSATTAPAGCGSKWEVDGVEFRTLRLADVNADVNANVRRNLLAHWCFGTAALSQAPVDPFAFRATWSGLDEIGLEPVDLPLAVFWWTGGAVEFLDMWSARRRVSAPSALTGWHVFLSERRVSDSQARFLQFQQHVDELVKSGVAPGLSAAEAFRFLPPAGFLPLAPKTLLDRLDTLAGGPIVKAKPPLFEWSPLLDVLTESKAEKSSFDLFLADPKADVIGRLLSDVQSELSRARVSRVREAAPPPEAVAEAAPVVSRNRQKRQAARDKFLNKQRNAFRLALRRSPWKAGFDLERFFGKLPTRIGLIDRETVDFTLQRSWFDEPIDLSPPSGAMPRVNLYMVEDSLVDRGSPPYVLFAKAIKPITWMGLGDR